MQAHFLSDTFLALQNQAAKAGVAAIVAESGAKWKAGTICEVICECCLIPNKYKY